MLKKLENSIVLKLAVISLTAMLMFLIVGLYQNSRKECIQDVNKELKTIHEEMETQSKKVDELNIKINHLETKVKKVDNIEKSVSKLDKEVQEKLVYREKISKVILKTGEGTKKSEARRLATAIDEVTVEFNKKYGYPRSVSKVLAIISTESDFRNLKPNDANAVGYAQVTPPCLHEVNKLAGWSYTMDDMYDPKSNLKVAWFIIGRDMKRIGSDKAVVAYNQGYRHLTRSVNYCRTDKTSYLYKVNARTEKYRDLLRGK